MWKLQAPADRVRRRLEFVHCAGDTTSTVSESVDKMPEKKARLGVSNLKKSGTGVPACRRRASFRARATSQRWVTAALAVSMDTGQRRAVVPMDFQRYTQASARTQIGWRERTSSRIHRQAGTPVPLIQAVPKPAFTRSGRGFVPHTDVSGAIEKTGKHHSENVETPGGCGLGYRSRTPGEVGARFAPASRVAGEGADTLSG